ncbi:mitotic interactor and substrate of PLK1 [Zootoca vivipara]|uniref:mitotic interactor and substrate of PLK1 n=1 Tax=Zootoca vivipara TaxID=8524 RepID=UPI00293BCFC9|nr:mitotic interactor and substrate of PLK1 [Zootoca vivipara]XP_034976492.2 mitotic interactor and substrate of PLK1 [Zootoca vivipara]XP_060131277.1 mitotic interactor and substrate of PLK1 [Zootoca vivipara]
MYIRRLVFSSSPSPDPEDEEPRSPQSGSRGELKFEEATGDEYFDLGHHREERAGDGWGMAEPPGNGSRSIHGRKDLWTAPPGRESKLEVVQSGSLYDIRAYKGEMKPSRLYGEDEEELRYRIRPEEASPEKAEELEEERREIIRSQVVRKSTTMAEKWSSVEELEAISAASAGREAAPATRSYSTGFAVCFDSPSTRWESTPVDPQNIDTEKINFAMARQQFLELEKANPKLFLGPRKPVPSSRTTQNVQGVEGEQSPDVYGQRRVVWSSESHVPQRTKPRSPKQAPICQNSAGDGWNYGQAEMSQNSSVVAPDGRRVYIREEAGEPLDWEAGGQGLAGEDPGSSDETPIEREIRLSMEREEAHRKERGMRRVNSRDELVEIQTKPLLLSADTPPASSRKGKDKHNVSFFVQREIEQESRREEDLQKGGRLSGTYSGGVCLELSERRKVFERDGEAPMMARMVGGQEEAQKGNPGKRTAGQDVEWSSGACQPSLASRRKQEGDLPPSDRNDTVSGQRVDSSGSWVPEDSGEEPAILREGHFAIPVRKLKFSSPGDREPASSRRQEGRPEWVAPREELYTVKTRRPRMSALIDQEIRDALQREVELQEQRRKVGAAAAGSKAPSRTSSQSSATSGIADSYRVSAAAAPDSPARSSPTPSPRQAYAGRSSLERPSAEEENTKRHREGGTYAGMELHDEIDSEVVKSTKVVCQRGLLAQLWETGQIRGVDDDSD